MFRIESYVTPILLSYVDKYVRDFKPADAQVSLWGGGVALHNLVLKPDVLEKEISLPFTLLSGRIHELLIQVPWTKIMSEPITVTIDTIECVLSLRPPENNEEYISQSQRTHVVEAPPGYMQALVRRIVSNIGLRVHHLILKYVHDDVVMSLNVKHLSVDSAGVNWEKSFADIDPSYPVIRRIVQLDDLTLCLDRSDADGKIRYYQEPLLYRCKLDLRVLIRLVSANTRRATSLSIQLRSSRLAWGITNDQLIMLLKVLGDRTLMQMRMASAVPKTSAAAMPMYASSNAAEPARSDSWSEWAWSWLPAWGDRAGDIEEAPAMPTAIPIYVSAYLDYVSLVFKMMEIEFASRKRARPIIELNASEMAIKTAMCAPTMCRIKVGARKIVLKSQGKCVCGLNDMNSINDESTIYLSNKDDSEITTESSYQWPEDDFDEGEIETANEAEPDPIPIPIPEPKVSVDLSQRRPTVTRETLPPTPTSPSSTVNQSDSASEKHKTSDEKIDFWREMSPVICIEYSHDRSPPFAYINPYDNPPIDFEYSDWVEECKINVDLQPLDFKLCMSLCHRVLALTNLITEVPKQPDSVFTKRTLTVEECDALLDNLPQRRINVDITGLCVSVFPWDHTTKEKAVKPLLILDLNVPKLTAVITSPLYPNRVCSAASQLPVNDTGVIWQGARLHITAAINSLHAKIRSVTEGISKVCFRSDLRLVTHTLLHKEYFERKEDVQFSYTLKIREANISGSAARLQAAYQVFLTIMNQKPSTLLSHSTLIKDALMDEEAVALDVAMEELTLRGYFATGLQTHVLSLNSMRITALHAPAEQQLKQAWVFSGPDVPSTTPYVRAAIQWCTNQIDGALDYIGLWMEPTAICFDPLFVAWLAYQPDVKPVSDSQMNFASSRTITSSLYLFRRKITPPGISTSSARGFNRTDSGAEVHMKARSETSDPSEKRKEIQTPSLLKKFCTKDYLKGENLLDLYNRVRHMLITVDIGMILVYVTMQTASAVDCATVRLAMERHAISGRSVLGFSMGHWTVHSCSGTRGLWQEIKTDGPTFISVENYLTVDSFPWKMHFADMTCYTLEVPIGADRSEKVSSGLKSQLKTTHMVYPRTILDLVTTNLTLSVVTKSMQYKSLVRKPEPERKPKEVDKDVKKMKYFQSGIGSSFKPASLKEFVRGPMRQSRKEEGEKEPPEEMPVQDSQPATKITAGPIVSLGVHMHADTPPIIVRLDIEQMHTVSATLHCLKHIIVLLQQPKFVPRHGPLHSSSQGFSSKSIVRSISQIEQTNASTSTTESESRSDLIPIFQAHPEQDKLRDIKNFMWFQWVISRVTIVGSNDEIRLGFNIDDVITTIDIQEHYNQMKMKIATASLRNYMRKDSDEWTAGILGGRILEAREATSPKDEQFLSVTVTQAHISTLPPSWKEELHPKVLEQKDQSYDTLWEVYAILAPLEALLQPKVIENIIAFTKEIGPQTSCPLETEKKSNIIFHWPFCYLKAGGLRVLVNTQAEESSSDDTIIINVGRISVNPHPDNPICRRPISSGLEQSWMSVDGGYEGRQYEVTVNSVSVKSSQFHQLLDEEQSNSDISNLTGGENPARKWSRKVAVPIITPIVYSLDISCVIAPPMFINAALICGPGLEFNLLTDCAVDLNIDQLALLQHIIYDIDYCVNKPPESSFTFNKIDKGVCPFSGLLRKRSLDSSLSNISDFNLDGSKYGGDSGVETVTSKSTAKSTRHDESFHIGKKTVSVGFSEMNVDPNDYLELFVTMGSIEVSLYTPDDKSPELAVFKSQKSSFRSAVPKSTQQASESEDEATVSDGGSKRSETARKSETTPRRSETIPLPHSAKGVFEMTRRDSNTDVTQAAKDSSNIPLLHLTLQQPNLYYWKKKVQKCLQLSIFNLWFGLGTGLPSEYGTAALVCTAKGVVDPMTEIPPALATMKYVTPILASSTSVTTPVRGNLRLDFERPIQFEICEDRIRRVKGIISLLKKKLPQATLEPTSNADLPPIYKLRHFMSTYNVDTITMNMSQISLSSPYSTAGWASACLQIALGARPDRIVARSLLTAVVVTIGTIYDLRRQLLQPMQLGIDMDSTWEVWRRMEGGVSSKQPMTRISIELDRMTMELRPEDLLAMNKLEKMCELLLKKSHVIADTSSSESSESSNYDSQPQGRSSYRMSFEQRRWSIFETPDNMSHYYKDDLRSGAFKILSGGQLPMAYQVTLHGDAVAWKYPHPRAITRVVAFPLPDRNQETECVLESFNRMLNVWEPLTFFNIPVQEPREIELLALPPEAVFATTWRFRVQSSTNDRKPYEFDMKKFLPRSDPLTQISEPEEDDDTEKIIGVTAEQLSGVLRVDSYFAPKQTPRIRVSLQMTGLEFHIHNSMPSISSQTTIFEGYYVSKPLMRSHRVLSFSASQTTMHAEFGVAGKMLLFDTHLSSEIMDCTSGVMESMIDDFHVLGGVSVPFDSWLEFKLRTRASPIHIALHVPRLRTINALLTDWHAGTGLYKTSAQHQPLSAKKLQILDSRVNKTTEAALTAVYLEGRVSLWLYNTSACGLRVGQEGTEEITPVESGSRLAYRWRNPNTTKKLRFSLANPSADWHWSNSIPFTVGNYRVRMEDAETLLHANDSPGSGVYMHVHVEQCGSRKIMYIKGRLILANMLRYSLLYKVRIRDGANWRSVSNGELKSESIGRSIVCNSMTEMVLKVKFTHHDTGWSGDIPLKECPKENVPWLVKVPSEGEIPYVSVWCRVNRARGDGRIIATLWPLYVLHSHLPLDTDVLIVTDVNSASSSKENLELGTEEQSPPLIQSALGRGFTTHLVAPGTTAARHNLSFQYRNIEVPVTRESIPMHYGVTDSSVFEKRGPVNSIDEVLDDLDKWLNLTAIGSKSQWPYSLVTKHWPGTWQSALLQPRTDVTVRYEPVRAGGGCSLQIHLCPIVLLCNASPIALTLRAHDAAPLCKLEPGVAISPPASILTKPFFMSVEMGRETFVSGQLEVCKEDPGRYGTPPPGQVAIDHPTNFAVQCNQKVALFTMYYETKDEMNIIGITSTYSLVNKLNTELLVSAIIAVKDDEREVVLHPKTFKIVKPVDNVASVGIPLSRFWLRDRWRSGDTSPLQSFLCLALPIEETYPAHPPVPIRLGKSPMRRSVALVDAEKKSVPIIVTQHKYHNRWIITVTYDQCPQFLVYNRTRHHINIGEPVKVDEESPKSSDTVVFPECEGARWATRVESTKAMHYSSYSYCAQYPTPPNFPSSVPFLTFSKAIDDFEPTWCTPVAATDGVFLVQLTRLITIKLSVQTHPHSTLLELKDTDHHDLSASDIRRRLTGSVSIINANIASDTKLRAGPPLKPDIERVNANDKLLQSGRGNSVNIPDDMKPLQLYSDMSLGTTLNPAQAIFDKQLMEKQAEEANERASKRESRVSTHKAVTLSVGEGNDDVLERDRLITLVPSTSYISQSNIHSEICSLLYGDQESERFRCVIESVVIEMSACGETDPLLAVFIDRVVVLTKVCEPKTITTLSIADVQVDNLQFNNGQFDFSVTITTRDGAIPPDPWPGLWNLFSDKEGFSTREDSARIVVNLYHESWTAVKYSFNELVEVDIKLGPVAFYIEDAYVTAVTELFKLAFPPITSEAEKVVAEAKYLQNPLRLQKLYIHPLNITLTLHTAVKIYIALDHSPLQLSAFKLKNIMTSPERLAHALTVHYLSAAILGAGWVVGGLELLGAPGALAARVGGASGGVRGLASTAAAALLRSLSALAGSLARNLDMLSGDEEHARRAAEARRRLPDNLISGIITGITNFAVNILGAVGGLAHHPLVGVAVGESDGTTALRRGIIGAFAKPLSATADLVAFAGNGLLKQTGWDPVPQQRPTWVHRMYAPPGWRRDCVRWTFKLAELNVIAGFEVLLNNAHLELMLTNKFVVVADPETERVVEMIDLRHCSLGPYQGAIVELCVSQRRTSKGALSRTIDEDEDEYHVSAAAMARVARYTGQEGANINETRVMSLLPAPGQSQSLYAALSNSIHYNSDSHFTLV